MRRIEEKFPSLWARIAMMKEQDFRWSNFCVWTAIFGIFICEAIAAVVWFGIANLALTAAVIISAIVGSILVEDLVQRMELWAARFRR